MDNQTESDKPTKSKNTFSHLSRACYGKAELESRRKEGVVDEVTVCVEDGSFNFEFVVTWRMRGGRVVSCLKIPHGSMGAFNAIPELGDIFFYSEHDDSLTPQDLCDALLKIGFHDSTSVMAPNGNRYWSCDLDKDNRIDLAKSMVSEELVGIADEKAGGIIGYMLNEHVDRIIKALNGDLERARK